MSVEVGAVFDHDGLVLKVWDPLNATAASLPDDAELWRFVWEHRDRVGGFAHSHPGGGVPAPSGTDLVTFKAWESALGRPLVWPIITSDTYEVFDGQGHTLRTPSYLRGTLDRGGALLETLWQLSYVGPDGVYRYQRSAVVYVDGGFMTPPGFEQEGGSLSRDSPSDYQQMAPLPWLSLLASPVIDLAGQFDWTDSVDRLKDSVWLGLHRIAVGNPGALHDVTRFVVEPAGTLQLVHASGLRERIVSRLGVEILLG